jgi:arginine repressor
MKRSTKIIIAILAVFLVGFIVYWNIPEHVFAREISQLRNVYSSDNHNNLNVLLNRTLARGEWGEMESAVKQYVKNRCEALDELEKIQNDEELTTALDVDKIRANSPEFSQILEKLKTTKRTLESSREKYRKVQSVDTATDAFASNLNDSLKERYKNELNNVFAEEKPGTNNADAFKMLQGMIETYIAELELLAKNPKTYDASGKELKFSDAKVKNEYYAILEKVKTIR